MAARIDAYFDCVSPFSYFAFVHLLRNKDVLRSHGVEIDFHPVFLGGINAGSGNKPPFTLPAKAKYMKYDVPRSAKYFGVEGFKTPKFFPILTVVPQRCIIYIKEHYPTERFEQTWLSFWQYLFVKNVDTSKPEVLAEIFAEHKFSEQEIKDILAAASDPKYKQALTDNTQKALDRGAYGAPYYWVRNSKGEEEPFFGSDRFPIMWKFLDLPVSEPTIKSATSGDARL
ncbi:hypothetical protein AJ80_00202 [Polytolypa hystricis UAMH7299]|uniref:Glutathione S-transferase kappa n=1 Tax=Polytolypa hystricis (strain UAMH7299) TaxID=1447883 RepID=A0A2B7Z493_POLH7|nr:hypothetical protein AJ80_00202 [Polytolypa hystricis UAMH7299]